jgi:hypothetical protein
VVQNEKRAVKRVAKYFFAVSTSLDPELSGLVIFCTGEAGNAFFPNALMHRAGNKFHA